MFTHKARFIHHLSLCQQSFPPRPRKWLITIRRHLTRLAHLSNLLLLHFPFSLHPPQIRIHSNTKLDILYITRIQIKSLAQDIPRFGTSSRSVIAFRKRIINRLVKVDILFNLLWR